MKYLKYFKENLSHDNLEDCIPIIEDCILDLIDSYPYEYFYTPDESKPLVSYMFKLQDKDDLEGLSNTLELCINRISHELNLNIRFGLTLNDRDDCPVISTEAVDLDTIKKCLVSPKFYIHYKCSLILTLIISK